MVCTGLMNLIEVDDEIFIIWVFHSWLKIAFLISESYQCNNNHINCARFIDIKHVQLKLLIFKNDLILIGISEVPFIAEAVASTMSEDISNTVDCFWLINDIEIELWKKLISVSLMMVQLANDDKVFQIFIISEHSYRISSVINLKTLFFKCFDNDQ